MKHNVSEFGGTREELPGKSALRRSWLWRAGRFCLLGLATLLTLLVLYEVQENWRGERAWHNYKAKMEAQGAVFDLAKLVPRPVPDDENFAMTPLLKPLLDLYPPGTTNATRWKDEAGRKRAESIVLEDPDLDRAYYDSTPGEGQTNLVRRPNPAVWRLGERISLEAWQRYYRQSKVFPSWPEPHSPAEDVLKALSRYDAELAELEQASHRPYARFNVHYDAENPYAIMLPHLRVIRNLTSVLQLRAVAELESGQVDAAFNDVNLMLALADSIKNEPILLSHLVRLAVLNSVLQTIWEGTDDHRWSQAQLEQFQKRFAAMDLLTELKRGLVGERAFGTRLIELLIHRPQLFFEVTSGSDAPVSAGEAITIRLIPKGWLYFEALNYSRVFNECLLRVAPDDVAQLDVEKIREASKEFERELSGTSAVKAALWTHCMLSKLLLPALNQVLPKSVQMEAMKDLAITAMALERYHLANHEYPQSLDALAPQWVAHLPDDPVSHHPFRYERTADGSFRLWSVGWNGVDDGGAVLYEQHGTWRTLARDQMDWVWPSAEDMRLKEQSD